MSVLSLLLTCLLRCSSPPCSLLGHRHASDRQACCLVFRTRHLSFMLISQSAAAVTRMFKHRTRLQQAAVKDHVRMQAHEKIGFYTVQLMRGTFDLFTGYKPSKQMSEERWLQRMLFLETVAGEQCSLSCSCMLLQVSSAAVPAPGGCCR